MAATTKSMSADETPAFAISVMALAASVAEYCESAPAFMQQYELMLVPLLSGGGMRVKVVEGLALGKAVLSTTLGAEGIVARDGENIVLRDGAAAWLQALRDYYQGFRIQRPR